MLWKVAAEAVDLHFLSRIDSGLELFAIQCPGEPSVISALHIKEKLVIAMDSFLSESQVAVGTLAVPGKETESCRIEWPFVLSPETKWLVTH